MADYERFLGGSEHPPEEQTRELRYTPPDHRERMAEINARREAAITEMRERGIPEGREQYDIERAIFGPELAQENERAMSHLRRIAEPLNVAPPINQWGRIVVKAGWRKRTAAVPFTDREIETISEARRARSLIAARSIGSGVEREFLLDSPLFPDEVGRGPFSIGLDTRPNAIWGILTSAKAAEDSLTMYTGISAGTANLLMTVRDLPSKLVPHPRTAI